MKNDISRKRGSAIYAGAQRLRMLQRLPVMRLALALALLLALCVSSCAGSPPSGTSADIPPELASATLIYIHGAGGDVSAWDSVPSWGEGAFALDWRELAAKPLSAPSRGYSLGRALAPSLEDVPRRIIAHSAGSWVAQGIADGMASLGRTSPLEIVFLDPFTALSIFKPFSGARMLGINAASARTWYTTRDPVPFTTGKVAAGEIILIDDRLPPESKGTRAHYDIITWYLGQTE